MVPEPGMSSDNFENPLRCWNCFLKILSGAGKYLFPLRIAAHSNIVPVQKCAIWTKNVGQKLFCKKLKKRWAFCSFSMFWKKGLEFARITLWASTCFPSSQARVTSVKSSSSLRLPNVFTTFSLKSFHCRHSFSDIVCQQKCKDWHNFSFLKSIVAKTSSHVWTAGQANPAWLWEKRLRAVYF